jgi:hypothetical protein
MLDQMPRRTNFFQAVVAIIHGHMAGDAVVEESAMLTHALTGAKREVDVVIRTNVAGYAVIVSVEATATGRRATGPWVEQMCAKHAGLPTNQLVLVSEKGFTPEALRLAAANHAVALSPADLDVPDPDAAVVGQLKSFWPKILALTPESASVQVERPDGGSNWVRALFDNLFYLADGTEVGTVGDWVNRILKKRFVEIADGLGLGAISEDMDAWFELEAGPVAMCEEQRLELFLRTETDAPELHRAVAIKLRGRVHIEVAEVPLRHMKLGAVRVSAGETRLGKRDAVVVVTEQQPGKPQFTLRLGKERDGA